MKVKILFYSSNGYLRKGKVEYQSQLTNLIVEKIMKYKHCDLPNLNWSIQCHTPLLKSLLKYWNSVYKTRKKNYQLHK